MADLPPGVYEESGLLYRDVKRESPIGDPGEDGEQEFETWTKKRPVALTLPEAKMRHWDWYHPLYGWVLEGYKLEKDRDSSDILTDSSQTVVATPEQQERITEGA